MKSWVTLAAMSRGSSLVQCLQLGEGEIRRCFIFAPHRGVWGSPAQPAAVPGAGSGMSGAEGPWLRDFPPGKGNPAQPWVLSTPPASLGAAGFVARPSRSEFGWAYFKNPKMFSLKMKL